MILRTEKQIIKKWTNNIAFPSVSILCACYNQAKYIVNCLDGFLSQKTSFAFEILILDDGSVDGSKSIIEYYKKKYPKIIRTFINKKNYKKIKKGYTFFDLVTYAKGKYIAICDGDDYWTDENKISKQFKLLEKNLETDLCFHECHFIDQNDIFKKKKFYLNLTKKNIKFSCSDIIKGGGNFCPTLSLFIRKSSIYSINSKFWLKVPVYDFYFQIISSVRGGAIFMNENMGVYRLNVPNSWSLSKKFDYKFLKGTIRSLIYLKKIYFKKNLSHNFNYIISKAIFSFILRKERFIKEKKFFIEKYKSNLLRTDYLFLKLIFLNNFTKRILILFKTFNFIDRNNIKKKISFYSKVFLLSLILLFCSPLTFFLSKPLDVSTNDKISNIVVGYSGSGYLNYDNYSFKDTTLKLIKLKKEIGNKIIILSSGKKHNNTYETELMQYILNQNNFFNSNIISINKESNSTYENIFNIGQEIRKLKGNSASLVTSPLHSLRVRLVWNKLNKDINLNLISNIDKKTITEIFFPKFTNVYVMFYEYIAIINYAILGLL